MQDTTLVWVHERNGQFVNTYIKPVTLSEIWGSHSGEY